MKPYYFHRWLIVIALILVCVPSFAQKRTISGYVMDAASKETLIGATIVDKNSGKGTNSYGFYTLTLNPGQVDLQISYVGYTQQNKALDLKENISLNFALETNTTLDEVVVEGTRATVSARSPQMSVVELPVQQIKSIPTLFGEADVLKAIQLLPGVQNGSEGSAGMYVRGGGPDENLLLLDGVPVYNVNHMMGFFSVFNPDALKIVTLYKGSFPAHFGGRLSSVVDIRMKEGDMQQYHGNVSQALIQPLLPPHLQRLANETRPLDCQVATGGNQQAEGWLLFLRLQRQTQLEDLRQGPTLSEFLLGRRRHLSRHKKQRLRLW